MPPQKGKIVGLDIGRHSVKAAWVEQRAGKPHVTRVEELPLPADGGDATSVIAPWIDSVDLAKQTCVVGLAGEQCMFQPLLLVPGDPRDLAQAASMEVVQFNEMSSEPMEFAYSPIVLNPVEKRLLLAMSRPSVLASQIQQAADFGVRVSDLIPVPVAAYNAVASQLDSHEEPVLFIDIGRSTTSVAIGSSAGLLFARSFSSGGQMFTDAIARAAGIAPTQAETMKLTKGTVDPDVDPAEGGLAAVAKMWLSEVQSCISVYQSIYPGRTSRTGRTLLTGGASCLSGLSEYVAAELGEPCTCMHSIPGQPSNEEGAQFATAIGLAVSTFDAPPVSLSLLPAHLKDELVFRGEKPWWIATAVVASLIMVAMLVGSLRDQRRKEAHLQGQNESLKRRQALVKEITQMEKENAYLRLLVEPFEPLIRTGPMTRDIITLLANCMDTDDWLTLVCDADYYFQPRDFMPIEVEERRKHLKRSDRDRLREDAEIPTNGIHRVIIEGYTRTPNLTTVKDLVIKLEQSEFVASADWLYDDKLVGRFATTNAPRDPDARRFVLDITIAKQDLDL